MNAQTQIDNFTSEPSNIHPLKIETNLFNMPLVNLDVQLPVAANPGLPEIDLAQEIGLKLLELAKSEPTDIQLALSLKEFDKQYDVGIKTLRNTYKELQANHLAEKQKPSTEMTEEDRQAKAKAEETDKQWKEKIAARAEQVAKSPNIVVEFQKALLQCFNYIAGEKEATTILLTHIFRLLPNSMGCVIHGASGSGKSDLVEKSAQFLPPEVVVRYTSYSNQALSYLGSLENKYIIGGELKAFKPGEDDSFQQAFRQLISENKITRAVTTSKPNGEFESKVYETKGPATFVMTTTREQTSFNDEFVNRLSWLSANDDPELTASVLNLQAEVASSPPDESKIVNNRLEIEAWREFHRTLQSLTVIVPFAKQIIPTGRDVTVRRLNRLLQDYIKASALLNQQGRQIISKGNVNYLVANSSDYATAYNLIMENAPRILDIVSNPARKTYEQLLPLFHNKEFTRATAQQALKVPIGTIKRHLHELKEAGCLELSDKKEGKSYLYKVVADLPPLHELKLVDPKLIGSKDQCDDPMSEP